MRDPFENVPGVGEARAAVMERALDFWSVASPTRRAEGAGWYDTANAYAAVLARETGSSIDHVAGILAITSVNQSWRGNQTLAARHLRTGWIGGLPSVREGLRTGVISGRKVSQFAKAIAGDERAVVVDRWIIRAFGAPLGRVAYPAIESGITDAADLLGISPRTLQATIWCIQRGKGE